MSALRLLAAGLIAYVATAGNGATAQPAKRLTIVYTAELHGNILPCRCPAAPLGGLARRIGWVDSLRQASIDPLLVVDAGSFLPSLAQYSLLPPDDFQALSDLHTDAAKAMHYDALVEDAGSEATDGFGLPWLSPNQAIRIERNGLWIGIVAVAETVDPTSAKEGIDRLAPVDLRLLLCAGDLHFADRVAHRLDVDIAIVARGACYHDPIRRDGILFLGPGIDGRYVGKVTLDLEPGGAVTSTLVELRPMNASVPDDSHWRQRVEAFVLDVERRMPGGLSIGE